MKTTIGKLKKAIKEVVGDEKKALYIDMLSDGMSGAGGFIRVFGPNYSIIEDIRTEDEEEAMGELGDPEPMIAAVTAACQKHGIDLVRDGALQGMDGDGGADEDNPIPLQRWIDMLRASWD